MTLTDAGPRLRMLAGLLVLLGAYYAAVYPYQSMIAMTRIGMGAGGFAALTALTSVLAVGAAVLTGILGDQGWNRRHLALAAGVAGLTGMALMILWPGLVTLVLVHGVLIPVSASLFALTFSLTGALLAERPAERDRAQAGLRACLSAGFLALLVLGTFAFQRGLDVMAVYVAGAVLMAALLGLIALGWPRPAEMAGLAAPSGLRLGQSLAELAPLRISGRVLLLGIMASAGQAYMMLTSLVLPEAPGRDAGDVALYVGLVAGWEVPFMLILGRLARPEHRGVLMAAGAAVYGLHLALMPVLAGSALLWVLPVFAGIGGAAVLVLPITYYQDLLAGRPGGAAALFALQKLVCDGVAALVFAAGMRVGATETALAATALSVAAALALWALDRRASDGRAA